MLLELSITRAISRPHVWGIAGLVRGVGEVALTSKLAVPVSVLLDRAVQLLELLYFVISAFQLLPTGAEVLNK